MPWVLTVQMPWILRLSTDALSTETEYRCPEYWDRVQMPSILRQGRGAMNTDSYASNRSLLWIWSQKYPVAMSQNILLVTPSSFTGIHTPIQFVSRALDKRKTGNVLPSRTEVRGALLSVSYVLNPLKLSGYYMYHQVQHLNILRSAHTVCFEWVSEHTAIISLHSSNWLLFITRDAVCLLHGTNWIFKFRFSSQS